MFYFFLNVSRLTLLPAYFGSDGLTMQGIQIEKPGHQADASTNRPVGKITSVAISVVFTSQ